MLTIRNHKDRRFYPVLLAEIGIIQGLIFLKEEFIVITDRSI